MQTAQPPAPELVITPDDIDKSASTAIYVQLRDVITCRIRSGVLPGGTRLPTVRALSKLLDVNNMTVARAFKELGKLGLIQGRGPRGTFICSNQPAALPEIDTATSTEKRDLPRDLSELYDAQRDDTFARMLRASSRPGVVALTQAYPDVGAFDAAGYESAVKSVLSERPDHLYAYVPPDGLPSLRAALLRHVCGPRGLSALEADEIVVTSGGQQSLALAAMTLLQPGDTVVVEQPTYFGALDLFRALNVRVVSVPMEADGPDMAVMERVVREAEPRLIFVIPTFHNPTGITTSLDKRKAILEVSRTHGVAILEDDCSSEMRFSGSAIPSIKALSGPGDQVFYFASMGKVFVPGIRLGFLAPPRSSLAAVVRQKTLADLHTSPLLQASFEKFLNSGAAAASLEKTRRIYAEVLDRLSPRLERLRAVGTTCLVPDGGLNLWLTLPSDIDPIDLFYDCLQGNVSILLGRHFCVEDNGRQAIRLSFGLSNVEAVLAAVDVLEKAINSQRARLSPQFPVLV